MRWIYATLAVLLACLSVPAHATAQVGDVLLLDGKHETIFTNPLEPFLQRNPGLRPDSPNTANWRGYVATFRIRDGGLWLDKVEVSRSLGKVDGEHRHETIDVLPQFFPGKREVFADWYTGVLLVPRIRGSGSLPDRKNGVRFTFSRTLDKGIMAASCPDWNAITGSGSLSGAGSGSLTHSLSRFKVKHAARQSNRLRRSFPPTTM